MLRASEKASPEARRVVWAVIAGLLGPLMDTTMLNIAVDDLGRDLQAGVGAGLLFPLMTSILIAASRGRAAGQLVAMVATPTALAPIVGPIVGGLLLHWLDWRWCSSRYGWPGAFPTIGTPVTGPVPGSTSSVCCSRLPDWPGSCSR